MSNPNITFKEQMAEARRTQILMGAAQIFAKKGFHKTTTKEIAQTAGVSEGTIYNYFENKRELLLAMVEMIGAQSIKNIVLDHPPDDPREFLTMILHDRLRLVQEHGHMMAPLIAEIFSDANLRELVYTQIVQSMTALVENYLQHQIDTGKFRQSNPIIVTRALIGAMVFNTLIKVSAIDARYEEISADAMIEEIVSLFLNGLERTSG